MPEAVPDQEADDSRNDATTLRKEVQQLNERLIALEESDRLQTEHIKIIRRLQLICIGLIAIGYTLTKVDFKDAQTQATLERLAIGLIATATSGLAGSEFLKPPTTTKATTAKLATD